MGLNRMWYKRAERQYRISLFFSAASLAGAFGGILAYGIGFMKGVAGLNGWVSHLTSYHTLKALTHHSDGSSSWKVFSPLSSQSEAIGSSQTGHPKPVSSTKRNEPSSTPVSKPTATPSKTRLLLGLTSSKPSKIRRSGYTVLDIIR
jgi:hypothetical protein